jgi:hypothetical protein
VPRAQVQLVLRQNVELFAQITPEVGKQLEEVKSALSHKVPNGNLNDVLAECFRITLDVCRRKKFGEPRVLTDQSLPGPGGDEHPGSTSSTPIPPPAAPSKDRGEQLSGCAVSRSTSTAVVEHDGRDATARSSSTAPELSEQRSRGTAAPPGPGNPPPPFASFDAQLDDRSRWVPTAVRWAVYLRDGGRCSFLGNDGHRCNSTYQLEFDHWRAFSLGGEHSVTNCRLFCSRHNRYEAERTLGARLMRKYFDRAA